MLLVDEMYIVFTYCIQKQPQIKKKLVSCLRDDQKRRHNAHDSNFSYSLLPVKFQVVGKAKKAKLKNVSSQESLPHLRSISSTLFWFRLIESLKK